jgi:hypothetical protein
MNVLNSRFLRRQIAAVLVVLLIAPLGEMACAQQQADPAPQQQPVQPAQNPSAPSTQPPAASAAPSQPAAPADPAQQSGQSASPQSSPQDQQGNGNQPVGTAAAPAEKPSGVAASRPAGAAIAPAKQRRVRSILIKVGVVVAAGVAIGTVAALSRSSSARPQ